MYYFGYELTAREDVMSALLGRTPEHAPATIEGYDLCVQRLPQIPLLARQRLMAAWPDDFQSYGIKRGSGVVNGVVWILGDPELRVLGEWKLDPGWFETAHTLASFGNSTRYRTVTHRLPADQEATPCPADRDSSYLLNDLGRTLRVAQSLHNVFFAHA